MEDDESVSEEEEEAIDDVVLPQSISDVSDFQNIELTIVLHARKK